MWNLNLLRLASYVQDDGGLGSVAIETGTCRGDATRVLARYFPRVITVELSEHLMRDTREKLWQEGFANIEFVCGNSATELSRILQSVASDETVFFLLDAHWSGDLTVDWQRARWKGYGIDTAHLGPSGCHPTGPQQCPLAFELRAIVEHCASPVHILIDDMRNLPPEGNGLKDHSFPGEDWSHLSRELVHSILARRLVDMWEPSPAQLFLRLGASG